MPNSITHTVMVLVVQLHAVRDFLRDIPHIVANDPRLVVHLGKERARCA